MKRFRRQYTVTLMSKALGVSNSGFYKWLRNNDKRAKQRKEQETKIKTAFEACRRDYGSPRLATELECQGLFLSKTTVARRMRDLNLCARPRKRFVVTTDSRHNCLISPNLLNREFEVDSVNQVWVSDITYIRVKNRWMYLTVMIDLADRMVVGWTLSSSMCAQSTVNEAFKIAARNRDLDKNSGLMIHSDRGIQYASSSFRALLKQYGCVQSMSRKGNCWDNAVAESFFKTIKTEELANHRFTNPQTLRWHLFNYIDGWYNTKRIHTSLGGRSPLQASLIKRKSNAA